VKLPNSEHAVVDVAKLRDYCLSLEHPRGRHKARVFLATLGLNADDAERLRDAILVAAHTEEAVPARRDEFGQRYMLDFVMATSSEQARVRSGWIVRSGEDFPRLTSCYVL
jgi:hypothetical protein